MRDFASADSGAGPLAPLPVNARIIKQASRLLQRHALRASDAVQLASALAARGADPRCETFVCFDARLRAAAASERFRLVPA